MADQWLASRHDLKPRTRAEYENLLAEKTRSHGDPGLSIAGTFSARPVNEITREQIANWVGKLSAAGKSASTVRHHYFVVRAILAQAVADNRIMVNPADHVQACRPSEARTADLPASWTILRNSLPRNRSRRWSKPLPGRSTCSFTWPRGADYAPGNWPVCRSATWNYRISHINPNAQAKSGLIRVERTVINVNGELAYDSPEDEGFPSPRAVDQPDDRPVAGLPGFPSAPERSECAAVLCRHAQTVQAHRETCDRFGWEPGCGKRSGTQATPATALAASPWTKPLPGWNWTGLPRWLTRRSIRRYSGPLFCGRTEDSEILPPNLTFHALRHTYASLCVAAGIPPLQLSRFMGHAKVTTTLGVYTHLFDDDHAETMAALEAMSRPKPDAGNVIALRG